MTISLIDISKVYRKRKSNSINALSNFSIDIYPGEIFALLGPNGAGKTTVIKIICNLIRPTSGRVIIMGKDLQSNMAVVGKHIGAVLEGSRNLFWRWTTVENLTYFAGIRGVPSYKVKPRISELAELLGFEQMLHSPVQTLSRGNQQRIALAAAMIAEPEIMLLDEPTLGLDIESTDLVISAILENVKKRKVTVLLTTHRLDLAADIANRVGIVAHGKLLAMGTYADIIKPLARVRCCYQIEISDRICPEATEVIEQWGGVFIEPHTFEVTLNTNKELYGLLENISVFNLPIKSIKEAVPNLATAYNKYVKEVIK